MNIIDTFAERKNSASFIKRNQRTFLWGNFTFQVL